MKFIDFFAGIGGIRLGLELAGHKCVGFCEFDKFARQSYKAMYSTEGEWECHDIRTASSVDLPEADLWCFGFPCFVKGTLITTHRGLVPIEDIKAGDMVLTHKNRFRRVLKPMFNVKKGIYVIKVQGSPKTECTGNHRFYVRNKTRKFNSETRNYYNEFSEPYWKAVEDFDGTEYIEFPVSNNSDNLYGLTEEELWLIGRYIADGYIRNTPRKDRPSNSKQVVLCIGEDKESEFENHVLKIHFNKQEERSTAKYLTGDKRLYAFCEQCGRGAENKEIPQFIIDLPPELLKIFIKGYWSGDGCCINGDYKATTVSKTLAYQLGECIEKAYHVSYSIHFTERPKKCIIEGREVSQRDSWIIAFRPVSEKHYGYFLDGSLWMPVKDVEYQPRRVEIVYNMEVEDDNSYTANNMGVHNCQDISIAGKQKGLQCGERSGLFYEIMRLLAGLPQENKPRWLLVENVKNLLSIGNGFDFARLLLELAGHGYSVQWQVINSKDYGVAQNRERVFIVGFLGSISGREVFPIAPDGGENPAKLEEITQNMPDAFRVYNAGGLARTLKAGDGGTGKRTGLYSIIGGVDLSTVKPKITEITDISRTITARYTAGVQNRPAESSGVLYAAAVLTPGRAEKRQNGRRAKEAGEPMFTLTAQDQHGVIIGEENALRIRRLTPRECWRLQGFPDEYFDKAQGAGISDSQLYKQAGNAVTATVARAIGEKLREAEGKNDRRN